ncbi:type VI secretion system tip protein VgrG [Paraburkholderia sp. MMS20-SJTN17]|uniref:Type VI secretion system tip protein VgrG n=1 Tax=Paraburkholderia translucens TaxID=2886945 RepID=A0ABS8KDV0_9BURK|nr:type VI secretion system tip protein TssI/VgrG [Paraburkholderia sp. MMS20-SJTN17]MCC8402946.1 type VI secretion system tip protein VgrG [Paraburkholderia sp. MMS20-SJTN17]
MMLTDTDRIAQVTCALGKNALVLYRMRGVEELGRLAQWNVELLADQSNLDIARMLGSDFSLSLQIPGGGTREYNGIVTALELARAASTQPNRPAMYRATVRPRLWLLTRASHCRFFHQMSVPAIIGKVLADYHIDFENKCSATYPSLEHCAQYRETDFDFVSRLAEREGIYYFFEQRGGKHRLILTDSSQVHGATPHCAALPFRAHPATPHEHEWVYAWSTGGEVATGIVEINDYDFEKPSQSAQQGLLARALRSTRFDPAVYAMQEHAPGYTQHEDAERLARAHVEAHQASNVFVSARTTARAIWPGGLVRLSGHPLEQQNREYLVVSAEYAINSDDYLSTLEPHERPPVFDCAFRALPRDAGFRAARSTPRARVAGPQTAVVVGPKGEEIHTDKYGRIKVQFHWEQLAPEASRESLQRCWVRVAQPWAGKGYGAFFLPRIGQEVLVHFIEGDPDQPLVIGSVYNAAQTTPYELAAKMARTTLKSNSTKGGNGFNEMRFDDTREAEQLFFHAERDLETWVKHDALTRIGNERHVIVEHDDLARCGGNRSDAVQGNQRVRIGGKYSLDVGGDTQHKSGANISVGAGVNVDIKGEANVTVEAGVTLTLKAGGNTIVLGPSGIAINAAGPVSIDGVVVQINCGGGGGGAGAASASPDAPADPRQADDGSK